MTSAVSAVTSAVRAVVKPHLTAVLCGQDSKVEEHKSGEKVAGIIDKTYL